MLQPIIIQRFSIPISQANLDRFWEAYDRYEPVHGPYVGTIWALSTVGIRDVPRYTEVTFVIDE